MKPKTVVSVQSNPVTPPVYSAADAALIATTACASYVVNTPPTKSNASLADLFGLIGVKNGRSRMRKQSKEKLNQTIHVPACKTAEELEETIQGIDPNKMDLAYERLVST